MSRKHFVAIAQAMSDSKPLLGSLNYTELRLQWLIDVDALVDALRQFNGSFDRARFLRACGIEAE